MQGPVLFSQNSMFFFLIHWNSVLFCFLNVPTTRALGNRWSLYVTTHFTQLTNTFYTIEEHIDAEKSFGNFLPLYFGVIF